MIDDTVQTVDRDFVRRSDPHTWYRTDLPGRIHTLFLDIIYRYNSTGPH